MLSSRPLDEMSLAMVNRRALNRFAWILGCGLALALSLPSILFAATFGSFTGIGAGIVATVALLAREEPLAPHLTRWDIAAALYAASLFAGLFVDVEGVRHYLLMQQHGFP
ncbi:MAG: hypothetical protein H6852_02250 [Geminicoccaceae bacterium]|nr:hypothetical protein [Geminicoccaceae bacterium]HRY24062.1 hypothetical protein [Geminicoccaceae bacterium]